MRGLRYVFDVPPAYISRISNEELIQIANDLLEKDNIKNHPMDKFTYELLNRKNFRPEEFEHITPVSVIIKKRQLSLLGHILRMDDENFERKVPCDKNHIRTKATYERL